MTQITQIKLDETSSILEFDLQNIPNLEALVEELPLEQKTITMYGKTHPLPRLTCMLGESYEYSGINNHAEPFGALISEIKHEIEHVLDDTYNCCLVNYYRDGSDYISWHSDDESSLTGDIVSISIGEERRFLLREIVDKKNKTEIKLTNGKVVVMRGDCQKNFQHSVPKTAKKISSRLNLTFRKKI